MDVKKTPTDVQIRQNLNKLHIDIQINKELLQANQSEIEFLDIQGKVLYKERLINSKTVISMNKINKKGFSIAVVKDIKTGKKIASETIILM